MTTTIIKQQCLDLIDSLADKSEEVASPILIGDVLAALDEAKEVYGLRFAGKFLELWRLCLDLKDASSRTGLKRPLQSIFEDIEWEVIAMNPTRADRSIAEVAKPSPATDLFIFLISLKLKN